MIPTTDARPAAVTPGDLRDAADLIERSASAAAAGRAARVAEWLRQGANLADQSKPGARLVLFVAKRAAST
jgi:hypothetical protein